MLIEIEYEWSMPNKWTFKMKPISSLLSKYVPEGGKNWVDPFSGKSKFAEITNDLNPETDALYHMKAIDFADVIPDNLDGVLFDPPYSSTQIKRSYENIGIKVTQEETSSLFYWGVKRKIAKKIKKGGYAISFGWNTSGFGKKLGFEKEKILIVNHGASHNDTLVVVERKI